MKKYLLLFFLLNTFFSLNAQKKYQDDNVTIWFLNEYPYANVLDYLHNPDTFLFCHYVLRRYEEKGAPIAINMYLYRNNNEWWSTSLIAYSSGKGKYWELTKPMWIQTDLSALIEDVITELDSVYYSDELSIIHTWVYVKCGEKNSVDLQGNLRDFASVVPKFTYVFMIGLLESYNNNIIKTYH